MNTRPSAWMYWFSTPPPMDTTLRGLYVPWRNVSFTGDGYALHLSATASGKLAEWHIGGEVVREHLPPPVEVADGHRLAGRVDVTHCNTAGADGLIAPQSVATPISDATSSTAQTAASVRRRLGVGGDSMRSGSSPGA
jgi:hypothetical protein